MRADRLLARRTRAARPPSVTAAGVPPVPDALRHPGDRLAPMATIVAFHAHPDDEVLLTGGTIARLAAEGQGGNGHRDHVRVHQVGARAAELAGVRVMEAKPLACPRVQVTPLVGAHLGVHLRMCPEPRRQPAGSGGSFRRRERVGGAGSHPRAAGQRSTMDSSADSPVAGIMRDSSSLTPRRLSEPSCVLAQRSKLKLPVDQRFLRTLAARPGRFAAVIIPCRHGRPPTAWGCRPRA
jgi:hypothetical protein